jgi:hypothetical protein
MSDGQKFVATGGPGIAESYGTFAESQRRDSPPTRDPWQHRSSGMKCATCMWFVEKAKPPSLDGPVCGDSRGALGRCRRHAPTLSGFPAVFGADWCGDHKLDETK